MTQSCPNISLTQFKNPIRDCYKEKNTYYCSVLGKMSQKKLKNNNHERFACYICLVSPIDSKHKKKNLVLAASFDRIGNLLFTIQNKERFY
ncbi:hypothetical protein BpHYR1_009526 [Brachionus plicatilis]|uniref:Uncharacterized protein n=1 Tax=Brachionus plicatilis TaxID=10195 RepID=A0A3M7SUF2_BRAPC|nr:hypothetical protein BpHYR1_009526 [Brachionus plicatilis]